MSSIFKINFKEAIKSNEVFDPLLLYAEQNLIQNKIESKNIFSILCAENPVNFFYRCDSAQNKALIDGMLSSTNFLLIFNFTVNLNLYFSSLMQSKYKKMDLEAQNLFYTFLLKYLQKYNKQNILSSSIRNVKKVIQRNSRICQYLKKPTTLFSTHNDQCSNFCDPPCITLDSFVQCKNYMCGHFSNCLLDIDKHKIECQKPKKFLKGKFEFLIENQIAQCKNTNFLSKKAIHYANVSQLVQKSESFKMKHGNALKSLKNKYTKKIDKPIFKTSSELNNSDLFIDQLFENQIELKTPQKVEISSTLETESLQTPAKFHLSEQVSFNSCQTTYLQSETPVEIISNLNTQFIQPTEIVQSEEFLLNSCQFEIAEKLPLNDPYVVTLCCSGIKFNDDLTIQNHVCVPDDVDTFFYNGEININKLQSNSKTQHLLPLLNEKKWITGEIINNISKLLNKTSTHNYFFYSDFYFCLQKYGIEKATRYLEVKKIDILNYNTLVFPIHLKKHFFLITFNGRHLKLFDNFDNFKEDNREKMLAKRRTTHTTFLNNFLTDFIKPFFLNHGFFVQIQTIQIEVFLPPFLKAQKDNFSCGDYLISNMISIEKNSCPSIQDTVLLKRSEILNTILSESIFNNHTKTIKKALKTLRQFYQVRSIFQI